MTNASLTETHQISSIPAATNFSAFSTKPGTCLAEQVGVNAPGNPKITTRLPAVRSRAEKPFGPTAQPSDATSINSKRRSSGSVSPVLIMDRPFTESVLVTPAIYSFDSSHTYMQRRCSITALRFDLIPI